MIFLLHTGAGFELSEWGFIWLGRGVLFMVAEVIHRSKCGSE
jgi:hypothetical protein